MPLLIFLLILFLQLPPASLQAAPAIVPGSFVTAASAIIYDMDNEAILFEQNADTPIAPASLTKIMSMFLALDHMALGHDAHDTPVTISREAAFAGGSSMGLHAGETTTLGKLLLGMAVSSGNDASHAVAEHVGGSVAPFVKMMNARAKALGMRDSHFANPHGLPHPAQYTTARDMLTLARAYLRAHPEALTLHNTKLLEHGGYTSWNKNPLLGQYPGADGLKTGWIRTSGHNLIFTATRKGKRLLGVIMGAPDAIMRGAEACRLLDAGFLVCQNDAPTVTAALDILPLDASRIDIHKTARDAGILKRQPVNKRLQGARKMLAKKSLKKGGKRLASKKTLRKKASRKIAKAQKRRNSHAYRKDSKKGARHS